MQFIKSGNLRALLVLCVCLPLLLALLSIFSTNIDHTVQSQPSSFIDGVPLFLCLWIGVSVVIVATILFVGSRLTFQDTDDSIASSDTTRYQQGGRHE